MCRAEDLFCFSGGSSVADLGLVKASLAKSQSWRVTIEPSAGQNRLMITKNIGMLLLAIYLILVGIMGISGFSLGAASILVPILALVAGILILIGK
jgi:hypothetical protein